MTEHPFKASNGIWITPRHDHVSWHSGQNWPKVTAALREYFQHERDQQLGRTRWPKNPDYVIYRDPERDHGEYGRWVRVINEQTGSSWWVWEYGQNYGDPTPNHRAAAHWYFTEGPGKKPARPWEDAKPGEVWRLTVDGEEWTLLVCENTPGKPYFLGQSSSFYTDDARITAGRKLLEADGSAAE